MKRIWVISTVRPLLMNERTDAILLGLRCACGADVTHDTTTRYLTAGGTRETGLKMCSQCVADVDNSPRIKTRANGRR